jgi:glycosyltransferase involved in cell wall biosynthesis
MSDLLRQNQAAMNPSKNFCPLATIIIPAYNAALWIRETLASVLNQTIDPGLIEIILVDDCSTDDTASIAAEILQEHPLGWIYRQQSRKGPSAAQRLALGHSRAPWIQFLDSDDLLHPKKLEWQLATIGQLRSGTAVVYSDWQYLNGSASGWKKGKIMRPQVGENALQDLLVHRNFIQIGSALFDRQFLLDVSGCDPRYEPFEDVNLLARLAMRGGRFEKAPVEEPILCYRRHSSASNSTRDPVRFINAYIANTSMVEDFWRSRGELSGARLKLICDCYLHAAYFWAGRSQSSMEQLVRRVESLGQRAIAPSPRYFTELSRAIGYRPAARFVKMANSKIYAATRLAGRLFQSIRTFLARSAPRASLKTPT